MPGEREHTDASAIDKRARDDALLTELTAPPSLEEARETYEYWSSRLARLPRHKRAQRKEAQEMAERWKERLVAAERARHGPGLLEQLATALGLNWQLTRLPSRRHVLLGLGVSAAVMLTIVIALLIAVIVFWPEISPIVQTLLNNDNQGGG